MRHRRRAHPRPDQVTAPSLELLRRLEGRLEAGRAASPSPRRAGLDAMLEDAAAADLELRRRLAAGEDRLEAAYRLAGLEPPPRC